MKEWLNTDTGEFKTLEDGVVIKGINWIEIPKDAEFAIVRNGEFELRKGVETWYNNSWAHGGCTKSFFENELGTDIVWEREKETVNPVNHNEFNPLVPQEGGDHYKLRPIQPIEYSERNGLSMSQGNIVKYITRHKEKNGVEDLAKVVHYALLESFFVYGIDGSTELKQRVLKMLGESN